MSHITKHKKRIGDIALFCTVAAEQGHAADCRNIDEVHMFGSQKVKAVAAIKLRDWRYEIAIDEDGSLYYDHFGSKANSMDYLHSVWQEYNVRRTEAIVPLDEIENYYMETLENGDRKMVLEYAD